MKMTVFITGWPKKLSHYQIYIKKIVLNRVKVCRFIRFLRQIKEMIKHYNILCVT